MITIFSFIVSNHLRNDLNTFKINSSDILVHSSSIAVLRELTVGWEVALGDTMKTLKNSNVSCSLIKGVKV